MKRLLKAVARRAWPLVARCVRPVVRKYDAHMVRLVSVAQREGGGPSELGELINIMRREAHVHRVETNLAVNSLIREVARLQIQIEALQEITHDAAGSVARLSLHRQDEDEQRLQAG